MIIERTHYLQKIISHKWNRKVKIITGIRRCGKSFLLSTLYKDYLKTEGVADDCFVEIALDKKAHVKYRNPNELYDYVINQTPDMDKRYYVFIDEIQLSFKIKNTGRQKLELRRVSCPERGISVKCNKTSLKRGKTATVSVTVTPAECSQKLINTNLTILTNDPENHNLQIRVVGLVSD